MTTDLIRYDLLVQESLKGVVRRVLGDAARDGLPGDHHFYVSFRTDHAGVKISSRLRERYPKDMTIVLQHQFDALTVAETAFEVGLSFSGVPERLRVPFDALTGFFDPSVQFGLKFEVADAAAESPEGSVVGLPTVPSPVPKLGARKLEVVDELEPKPVRAAGRKTKAKEEAEEPPPPADPSAGAEVVSLDAFRKKS